MLFVIGVVPRSTRNSRARSLRTMRLEQPDPIELEIKAKATER